jgi:hypothetical protein
MTRENLPQRRANETFEFVHPPGTATRYSATLGFYDDGRIGEIFIDGAKVGSDAEINTSDAAVLMSIALQHGATVSVLRHAVSRNSQGVALGVMGALLDVLAAGEGA